MKRLVSSSKLLLIDRENEGHQPRINSVKSCAQKAQSARSPPAPGPWFGLFSRLMPVECVPCGLDAKFHQIQRCPSKGLPPTSITRAPFRAVMRAAPGCTMPLPAVIQCMAPGQALLGPPAVGVQDDAVEQVRDGGQPDVRVRPHVGLAPGLSVNRQHGAIENRAAQAANIWARGLFH